MQKKFIALAVAGLVSGGAFAQSNVTVYGVLDIGYINSDTDQKQLNGVKSSGGFSNTGFQTGALSTSRLGFKGTEALGNGLNANFIYELGIVNNGANAATDPVTDNAAPLNTRLAQVGLSGSWGSVDLGRQEGVVAKNIWTMGGAGMKNNVVGQLYDSNSGLRMAEARLSSVITYTSPNFSGFQGALQYGKSSQDTDTISNGARSAAVATSAATTTAGTANAGNNDFSTLNATVTYGNGPLNVGLGYSENSGDNLQTVGLSQDANNKKAWILAGNYDFKVAKVFAMYTDGSNKLNSTTGNNNLLSLHTSTGLANNSGDSLTDVNGYELGVQVPMGNFTFVATYMNGERDYRVRNAVTKYNADVDGFQLMATYALSKRTTAYAAYGEVNNNFSNTVSTQRYNDTQQYAMGLRHSF